MKLFLTDQVTVFGDGNSHPVSITRQHLEEKHSLKTIAAQQSIPAAVKTTRKTLGEKLFEYVIVVAFNKLAYYIYVPL